MHWASLRYSVKAHLRFTLFVIAAISFLCYHAPAQQNRGGQMVSSVGDGENSTARALIIGVSNYANLPGANQLSYAHKDAILFKDFLLSKPWFIQPENIMFYINEEATNIGVDKTSILNKFYALLKESKPGDMVIFYFAGHGDVQNVFGEDLGFLLLNGVKEPKIEDYYTSSDVIRIKELQNMVSLAAGNIGVKVLLIIDACHSGKIISSDQNSDKVLTSLNQEWSNAYKIVSSQPNQYSQESSRWGGGHGVFSWYLVNGSKGLADLNKDEKVNLFELKKYVEDHVSSETEYQQIPTATGNATQVLFFVDPKLKEQALASITSNFDAPLGSTAKPQQISQVVTKDDVNKRSLNYFFNLSVEDEYQLKKFEDALKKGDILPQYTEDNSPKDIVKNLKVNNVQVKDGHQPNAYCVAFNKSGDLIATGGEDGKIRVWDNKSLTKKAELDHSGVLSLIFSNDNRMLISAGWNEEIKMWDASTYNLIKSFRAHNDDIRCLAIDHTGKYLASSGDDLTIKIWEVQTGNLVTTLPKKHNKRITSVQFAGRWNQVVSAGKDGLLIKWDTDKGQVLNQINIGKPINSIAISLSNSNIVAGCEDGYLGVYSTNNLEKVKEINLGLENINAVAIDNDANYLIAGGKTRKLIVYDNYNENKVIYETSLPRGVTNIDFTPVGDALGVAMHGGQWAKLDLTIPSKNIPANALSLYEILAGKPTMEHLKTRLTELFISTIFSRSLAVLEPFLTGGSNLPGSREIEIARAELEKAKTIVGDDSYYLGKIKVYSLLLDICETYSGAEFNELPKAIAKIDALIKEMPDASFTYNILSSFYQKLRKLEDAKKAIGVAAKNIPDWVEPKLSLAYTYFLERNYDSASYINDKVILAAPNFAKAYIQQANLQNFLADFYSADENYKKGIAIDSLNPNYLCSYARLNLRMGEVESAKKLVNKAMQIDEKNYQSYFLLAEINHFSFLLSTNKKTYASQQMAKNAYDNYVQSLKLSPGNAEVKARYADFLVTVVNNPELIDKLNDILPEEKGNKKLKLKQFALIRMAKKYFNESLKSDPYLFFSYYGMLKVDDFLGDKKGLTQTLEQLEKLSAKNPQAEYYIARYYSDHNKKKKAVKFAKSSIKSDGRDITPYILLLKLNGIKTEQESIKFLSSNYNSAFIQSFSVDILNNEFFYY